MTDVLTWSQVLRLADSANVKSDNNSGPMAENKKIGLPTNWRDCPEGCICSNDEGPFSSMSCRPSSYVVSQQQQQQEPVIQRAEPHMLHYFEIGPYLMAAIIAVAVAVALTKMIVAMSAIGTWIAKAEQDEPELDPPLASPMERTDD